MNFRFVWHILRKDTRRLWWLIAVEVALLWRLVHFDSLRSYAMPGTEESWLNFLLPLVWALLIALTVLEDPINGEAPFWTTVPCRWPSLLASKAAFGALFIHLPYFAGCMAILQARGFSPSDNMPALLAKQLTLLAITLPSLALATIVSNVTQFMMIAIALATAVAVPRTNPDLASTQYVRNFLMFSMTAAAAVWIAISQYGSRRTSLARWVGGAAVLVATVIWWLPRESFYGLQAALSSPPQSAATLSLHRADPSGEHPKIYLRPVATLPIAIPVRVDGLANGQRVRIEQAALTLEDSGGHSYQAEAHMRPLESRPVFAWIDYQDHTPDWQILAVDKNVLDRLGDSAVTLKGRMRADYYRRPDPVWASVGTNTSVPNLGRCSSNIQTGANPDDEMLHVECESPGALPSIGVELTDPATGRRWDDYLRPHYSPQSYLQGAVLSPINRYDSYFSSTDEEHYRHPGAQWLVPREVMEYVRIGITPEIQEGSRLVDYEIANIRLNQFLVKR